MSKRQISLSLEKEITSIEKPLKNEKQVVKEIKEKKDTVFKMPMKVGDILNYDKSKEKPLDRAYFRREVVDLAQDLLGKVIVHETEKGEMRGVIVETQAYKAPLDKGCHAYNNNKTQRTKYFWLDGGHLYVYTIYMPTNICINIVAGLQNQPQAVLIRAIQPVDGLDIMRQIRKIKSSKIQDLTNGPGKVGQSLLITKQMNGKDLTQGKLRVVDAGINNFKMGVSKRINIDYAQEWRQKLWRFYIQGNSYVSKVNPDAPPKIKKK